MEDEDFNNYILNIILRKVVLPALMLCFKTQWDKKYPDTPWIWGPKCVKLLDEKEEDKFQERLRKTSDDSRKQRMKRTRNHNLKNMKSEESWKNGKWDIGKLVYALVDSKLFTLDKTDESGKPLSEHLTEIRKLRNDISHLEQEYDNDTTESEIKSLEGHIKYLGIPQSDMDNSIKELQKISTQEKPVCSEALNKVKTENYIFKLENDNLAIRLKLYENIVAFSKRERRLENKLKSMEQKHHKATTEINKLNQKVDDTEEENEKLCDEIQRLTAETTIENERLHEEIERLTDQTTELKESSVRAEKDLEKKTKSLEQLKGRSDKWKSKYFESKKEIEKLTLQLDDSESKSEKLGYEIEELTDESKIQLEKLNQAEHDLEKINVRKHELEKKIEKWKLEYNKIKQEKDQIKRHADDLGSENEKLHKEKVRLTDELRNLNEIKSTNMQKGLQARQEENGSTLQDVREQYQDKHGRILYDSKQGYGEKAVKFGNEWKDLQQKFFKKMEEELLALKEKDTCRQAQNEKIQTDIRNLKLILTLFCIAILTVALKYLCYSVQ